MNTKQLTIFSIIVGVLVLGVVGFVIYDKVKKQNSLDISTDVDLETSKENNVEQYKIEE